MGKGALIVATVLMPLLFAAPASARDRCLPPPVRPAVDTQDTPPTDLVAALEVLRRPPGPLDVLPPRNELFSRSIAAVSTPFVRLLAMKPEDGAFYVAPASVRPTWVPPPGCVPRATRRTLVRARAEDLRHPWTLCVVRVADLIDESGCTARVAGDLDDGDLFFDAQHGEGTLSGIASAARHRPSPPLRDTIYRITYYGLVPDGVALVEVRFKNGNVAEPVSDNFVVFDRRGRIGDIRGITWKDASGSIVKLFR